MALTRKPKGLGRRNFAQGYPRSHATPIPTSRSKGQKSRWGGGILWRRPSRTACFLLIYEENVCTHACTSYMKFEFFNGHVKTAEQQTLYSSYDDTASRSLGGLRPRAVGSPLLAVPNVTTHPLTANVPTSYYSMWQNSSPFGPPCSLTRTRKNPSSNFSIHTQGQPRVIVSRTPVNLGRSIRRP